MTLLGQCLGHRHRAWRQPKLQQDQVWQGTAVVRFSQGASERIPAPGRLDRLELRVEVKAGEVNLRVIRAHWVMEAMCIEKAWGPKLSISSWREGAKLSEELKAAAAVRKARRACAGVPGVDAGRAVSPRSLGLRTPLTSFSMWLLYSSTVSLESL